MRRRQFIKSSSGLLLASSTLGRTAVAQQDTGLAMPNDTCAPTVRLTAGPYYTLDSMRRSDIREDRPGIPLRLTFTVVDDYGCFPIPGSIVDVWHSDAGGLYSGVMNNFIDNTTMLPSGEQVDTRDRPSFLRGHQITDDKGEAHFTTIYPGWYSGRLPHIHVRALLPGAQQWSAFVTQLFTPPEVDRIVYQEAPYRERGFYPMTVERDLVLRGNEEARQQLTIAMDRTANGIHGRIVLAL